MELEDRLAMEAIAKAQAEEEVKEDLRPYRGRWVALRKGYVVAAADDLPGLRRDPRVLRTDTVESISPFEGDLFV